MPILTFKCLECSRKVKIFSHRELFCPKCGSDRLKSCIPIPLESSNKSSKDYFGNTYVEGIQEDVKKRSRRNTNKELKEEIEKYGESMAKQQGWIKDDGSIRTDWDDK